MKIKESASSFLKTAKLYWHLPPKGRYMSYKEILSLSVGGIGIRSICYCISPMVIAVGNTLIGNTIGINPSTIYFLYVISFVMNFPLTALRAKMIDNSRSMKGKYRPYILSMGIPSALLGIGFIWMPYDSMSYNAKCVTVLLFNIGFQFFYNFMVDAYDSIINVLSANTIERTDVIAVRSVIENLAPSIGNLLLPLLARLITGDNILYDIRIYRIMYPPLIIIGFAVSLLIYVNTEEKIIQARTHIIQIKLLDAFRAVARNKYFWIISLAGWLGFLEGSFNSILGWMYNYQSACGAGAYTAIIAISGNASFWPNLFAPFLIRRFGKKKLLILSNLLNVVLILPMLPVIKMTGTPNIIWILLIFIFINQFITSLGHFMNPSINADIRDYQQYITGERIDGMFTAVGLIGSVVTLVTSSVLPMLYEHFGLNRAAAIALGYSGDNVYDVLFNREYFISICSVLIIASVVGALLNVIPFFFYDLSETKQKAMIRVLKIRAMFEDYANEVLSDEAIVETVDIIREAKEYFGKSEKDKSEIAEYVINELNRFDIPESEEELREAREIFAAGLDGFSDAFAADKKQAKKMPKGTPQEKQRRKEALHRIRELKIAKKAAEKYFKNGIEVFDAGVFEKLFTAEDENETGIRATVLALKQAREDGDKEKVGQLSSELSRLQANRRLIGSEIKKATQQNTMYYRAAKPYLDAKRKLAQAENYSHYSEIEQKYDEAKRRAQQRHEQMVAAAMAGN